MAKTEINVEKLIEKAEKLGVDLNSYADSGNGVAFGQKMSELYRNNPKPYPSRTDFTKYFVYKGGKILANGVSKEEHDKVVKDLNNAGAVVEKTIDTEAYNAAKTDYDTYATQIAEVFHDGLLYVYGVHDHPKANKAFSIAWEHGHSSGYSEVANYFDDLVELLK